jgi:hypothetical protein
MPQSFNPHQCNLLLIKPLRTSMVYRIRFHRTPIPIDFIHTKFYILKYKDPVWSCCTTCCLSHKYKWFCCTQFAGSIWVRTWKFCLLSMAMRSVVSVMNRALCFCGQSKLSWSNKSSFVDLEAWESWKFSDCLIVRSWTLVLNGTGIGNG